MSKRIELRLAKVLRHVLADMSVEITALADNAAKAGSIAPELATTYVWELIADNYLDYNPETEMVTRGSVQYPSEIILGGYYLFESECWSCDKYYDKQLDIYTNRVHWECKDCDVKWSEGMDK